MLRIHDSQNHLLVIACLVATATAGGWDDFANNLATDLAPIFALFGEQATKQFLSESTTRLDNFIFAMAPLGILTAVVSAIRVCGGPSLRAFIGRAQEGGGIAEAELCSSTSRDVCELYHNGAIVRVFGRPKILEIVHDRDASISFEKDSKAVPECGIHTFQEYIKTKQAKDAGWEELGEPTWSVEGQPLKNNKNDDVFAPNPNLSFNIGIREQPRWIIKLVALAGLLIQASIVIFGFLVTYTWRWTKEDAAPSNWAFPLMALGTLLLNIGMFYCAYLVENSTKERVFQRAPENKKGPRFHVIQPGNQTIGDQTFDPFSFTDAHESPRLDKYTTSWKNNEEAKLGVWFAAGSSISGFVLQFVGLRAIHSAVSVLQLGAILIMTTIRAGLRTQRLGKGQNLLRNCPDEVEGHELDWLALEMAKSDQDKKTEAGRFWSVIAAQPKPISLLESGESDTPSQHMSSDEAAKEHRAERVFLYRSRLAELTSHITRKKSRVSSAWDDSMVHVRQQARQLKKAIESSAEVLLTDPELHLERKGNKSITWIIDVAETSLSNSNLAKKETSTIHLTLHKVDDGKQPNVWEINQKYLEAVLGLWAWSMISDPKTEEEEKELRVSTASEVPMSRIMAFGVSQEDTERARTEMELWMEDFPSTISTMKWSKPPCPTDQSPSTLWKREVGELGHDLKLDVDSCPDRLRLYGWQVPSIESPAELRALTTTISGSIPDICAQEIYQSFLRTIAEGLTSVEGLSRPATSNKGYFFTNDVLVRLADSFRESGLGSIKDAYSIIVPVLRSKLPLPGDVLPTAYSQAESCRKEGNFQKAEAILSWAWKTALTTNDDRNKDALDACMLEFGELYRYAIFSGDVSRQESGFRGISWMQKEVQKAPERSSIASVASRYADLAVIARKTSETKCSTDDVIAAASNNDRTRCLWLISRVKGLSSSSTDRTALSWAAERGWSEIVKAALEIGSALDSEDRSRRTPLSYAAEHGHVQVVELLVKSGAVPNLEDVTHRTPMSYAVAGGHLSVMELLLKDRRVSIYTRDKYNNSLLHWAATNGQNDAIDGLFKHNAKDQLNQPNEHGHTPLALALLNSHLSTAAFFFEVGANVHNIKIEDIDALEWAIKKGEWTSVTWLLGLPSNEGKAVVVEVPGHVLSMDGKGITDQFADDTETEFTMGKVQDAMVHKYEYGMKVEIWEQEEKREVSIERWDKIGIIDLLLSRVGTQDEVTEGVLKAAADFGPWAIKPLLDFVQQRGQKVTITEGVVKAAAANYWVVGAETIRLLLDFADQHGQQITITESIIKAATTNEKEAAEDKIKLLVDFADRRGQHITITESIVKAAVTNRRLSAPEITKLVLDFAHQRGQKITITEEIVAAAARNGTEASARKVVELLLDGRAPIEPTQMMKLIAASFGEETLKLLADYGGQVI